MPARSTSRSRSVWERGEITMSPFGALRVRLRPSARTEDGLSSGIAQTLNVPCSAAAVTGQIRPILPAAGGALSHAVGPPEPGSPVVA
jgi:hypothetical protein